MTSQTLPLNLIPKGVCPRIYVSQYDKGQEWNFDLYAGTEAYTIPSEASVTIQGTKPDKTGFQYACSFSGNRVEATEQQQMTVIAGEVPAEIRIENNNEIIATLNFIIAVEKAALADDTVISETDLPLIEEAIEVLGHADELVQRIEGDVTTSGNNALKAEGFAVGQQNGADVASGSPYYHNSAKYYKEQAADSASTASNKASDASGSASAASGSASSASANALKAEGFAVGQQNGADVASGSPYYHNSAKYYKEQAADSASTASTKAGEAAASAQAAAQSAAHLTIDSAMSTTSQNAVQNKVVTGEINSVKETLTNQINNNGSKNILPQAFPTTKYGVTFLVDDNGVITFSGTPSEDYTSLRIDFTVEKTGAYRMLLDSNTTQATWYYNIEQVSPEVTIKRSYEAQEAFTLTAGVQYSFYVRTRKNVASSGTVYPMVCSASDYDLDPTYVPPAMTNHQLTLDKVPWSDEAQVGAVNLFEYTRKVGSYNLDGVTYTVNADRSIRAVSTGNNYESWIDLQAVPKTFSQPMKISGAPQGSSQTSYFLFMTVGGVGYRINEGEEFIVPAGTVGVCYAVVKPNTTCDVTFKPMITPASYNGGYAAGTRSNVEMATVRGTATNATGIANANANAIYKVGGVVVFNMFVKATAAISTGGTIMTLPYAPNDRIHFQAAKNYTTPTLLKLETTGVITLSSGSLAIDDTLIATLAYETDV